MNNDKVISVHGNQHSPLNTIQINEARSFLSQIYGNTCGAGADTNIGCGKTVSELRTIWEASFLSRNEKVPERKHPFLVVNEKYGYGLHRFLDEKFDYGGNVNYFCKSCNMIFNRRSGSISTNETTTFQSRKSHSIRPKFKNELRDVLAKTEHICYKAIINKWSGRDDYNCSQELLENAFDQEFDTVFDLIDVSQFDLDCKYPKCNGNHICLKGIPPTKKQSDFDAFSKEQSEDN